MSKRDAKWNKVENRKGHIKYELNADDPFTVDVKLERRDRYAKKMKDRERDRRRMDYWD